jgi:hypothetical protein
MINTASVHIWLPLDSKDNANDFLELARSKILKSGTVGHVSLELEIEKNEYTTDLVETYLSGTKIPHELLPINLRDSSLLNSPEQSENRYYRIYWSFYSGSLTDSPYSYGKFIGDCMDKYNNRGITPNPKYASYFQTKTESVKPNLIKFAKSIPFLSTVMKLPMLEQTMKLFGLDNFPAPYDRKLGIKEIKHVTHLKSKRDALFNELEILNDKKCSISKAIKTVYADEEKESYNLQISEINKNIDDVMDTLISVEDQCSSKGETADAIFKFPIKISDLSNGLDFELLLKKMREIEENDSAFDLYNLNCSETVLQILSSGTNTTPSIFDRRGLIFKIANPYHVKDLCEQYANEMSTSIVNEDREYKGEPAIKKRKLGIIEACLTLQSECPNKALTKLTYIFQNRDDTIPCLTADTLLELNDILNDGNADFACLIYTSETESRMVSTTEALAYSQALVRERANTLTGKKRSRIDFK